MGSLFDPSPDRSPHFKDNSCDLVVIGGGINGSAIARDAALRGLSVILLEKTDFGSGASTKTSKLAHGGLRYLENLDFHLVKESLYERALLLKNAPHLVHPLPFVLPVYSSSPRPLWQIHGGLFLYDYLARESRLPKHRKLSVKDIANFFPQIELRDLQGGCSFYDAQMLDNRLVIETVLGAEAAGAIVLNYAEVTTISRTLGKSHVHFRQRDENNDTIICCRAIVNSTGAWANHFMDMDSDPIRCKLAPTKGIHLVIPHISKDYALLLRAPQDGRVIFVIPWEGYSLLGTTDTLFQGDPDLVKTNESDVDYLLTAFHAYFPSLQVDRTSIISQFAGLRPLVCNGSHSYSPSLVSRTHHIETSSKSKMITILGGKFTTHRKIAEDVVDQVVRLLGTQETSPCVTAEKPLPGAWNEIGIQSLTQTLLNAGLNKEQTDHLLSNYGKLSLQILERIHADPREKEQICSGHPHIYAEITHAIVNEHAKHLEDWFCRRTSIAYSPCKGIKCLRSVATRFAFLLGWDKIKYEKSVSNYETQWKA